MRWLAALVLLAGCARMSCDPCDRCPATCKVERRCCTGGNLIMVGKVPVMMPLTDYEARSCPGDARPNMDWLSAP